MQPSVANPPDESHEDAILRSMSPLFDAAWYLAQNPDVAGCGLEPLQHFVRHGAEERRNPNGFFDGAWYLDHYPDVATSGQHPLVHYLSAGAADLRNPHPRFDAAWYVSQHQQAADNPLLFHLQIGRHRGYPTEKPLDIGAYLPSVLSPPPLPRRVFVDIVIPVYRGLAETRCCITSVLADRNRPLGRIIVVDDRGPEPALSEWLRALAADGHIHLVRNERNLGFVATANRGMDEAGDHDVALLNSDTEVPDGWLNRLMAQAYAEPRIATVSPLSNNATICSYPHNGGGPMPLNQTVAQLDAVCQSVNTGRFVNVPTTVGFAMYIRRAALNELGNFDAEHFKEGYGEENDFCLRASARGWTHRLACDTFVYHKGSVSFGDRMEKLSARAMGLILERFPNYARDVALHVNLGAADPFRFAITAGLFQQKPRPVVLMVSHNLGGGIRRHIDILIDRFRDQAHILLLAGTSRGATLSVPSLPDHPELSLPAERIEDLLTLLRSFNVSRVHIHHLLGMDMDIPRLIRGLGVPFDVTLHDYYAICPQINLLPWRHGLYCGEPDIAACNDCIAHRGLEGAQDILMWRAERVWQFRDADRVLCPSQDALARLQRHGLADKAVYAPHEPVDAEPWRLTVRAPGARRGDPLGGPYRLRIAVLGTLVDHKGARSVAAVAEAADPKTTEIHLIGHIDGPFPQAALKRMKVTGRYDHAELPALIERIAPHVIWFPMTWPETFSYTLSAAIEAGVAIAATRIGAFPERLRGRPLTWLADIATPPAAWLTLFETIRSELANNSLGQSGMRTAEPDFYARDYLPGRTGQALKSPTLKSQALKSQTLNRKSARPPADRPRIAILPARSAAGLPTQAAYIRLLQPLHHPAITHDAVVGVFRPDSILHEPADVIVTQPGAIGDADAVDRLAGHARRTGATLVFDLDDDLSGYPDSRAERRMLDVADAVWVSSSALAKRLASIRTDAVVLETRLDERLWQQTAAASPLHDDPVRILWIGTRADEADFDLVRHALTRIRDEYGRRVTIDCLGRAGGPDVPPGVADSRLHIIAPSAHAVQSYPGLVNWLTQARPAWHIGLAPRLDTPLNRLRSPVNALEYVAMGMLVLASDVQAYRGSAAEGRAGQLVANTPQAWYSALDELMRNRDRRRALIASARKDFLASGTLAGQAAWRREAWKAATGPRRAVTAA